MEKQQLISFKVSVLEQIKEMLRNPKSGGLIIPIPAKYIQGVRGYLKYHLSESELVSCEWVGDTEERAGYCDYVFKLRAQSSARQILHSKLRTYVRPFLTEVLTKPTTFQNYIAQYNQKHGTEFFAEREGNMWRIKRDYDKEAVMLVYRALKAENPENVQESLKSLERHALDRYSLPI